MNDEKKTEFVLEYPIPLKDKRNGNITQVKALYLSRIKAKHMRLFPKEMLLGKSENMSPVEMIPLIAGLSDLPVRCIDELDFSDLMKLAEVLEKLLGEFGSPETGSKNSGSSPM